MLRTVPPVGCFQLERSMQTSRVLLSAKLGRNVKSQVKHPEIETKDAIEKGVHGGSLQTAIACVLKRSEG
jgi:hypothetical protein